MVRQCSPTTAASAALLARPHGREERDQYSAEGARWDAHRPFRALEAVQPRELTPQNIAVKKQHGRKRLVLRRCGDVSLGGELVQKGRHFGSAARLGRPLANKSRQTGGSIARTRPRCASCNAGVELRRGLAPGASRAPSDARNRSVGPAACEKRSAGDDVKNGNGREGLTGRSYAITTALFRFSYGTIELFGI